jgi:hypothetical protein
MYVFWPHKMLPTILTLSFLPTRRHDTEPKGAKPWWKEAIRTEGGVAATKVRSKIACYRLTDKLRESGRISEFPALGPTLISWTGLVIVESLPRFVQPSRMSVDYKKIRSIGTHFGLPIPLKHWEQEAFSLLDVLDKMIFQSDFEHPHLRDILLSDELARLELGMVAKLLDERLILSPLVEYVWSSSVEHLSDQLSQHRFRALMRPSMATYLPLVDLRRPILWMLDAISVAIKDAPRSKEA